MLKYGCATIALLAGTLPMTALAQDRPAPEAPAQESVPDEELFDEPAGEEEIVVTGELRDAVPDVVPELQLSPADVRAFGVSSIDELITELAPLTGSATGRGQRPVILLNGRRISGFAEIRDLPPEAIERMDILPPEAALRFGYPADQRVVNIVLRERFQSLTGELEGRMSAAGGNERAEVEAGIVKIRGRTRLQLNVEYEGSAGLLESERDIVREGSGLFDAQGNVAGTGGAEIDPALSALAGTPVTVAGVPASAADRAPTLAAFLPGANLPNTTSLAPYRTLRSPSDKVTLNTVYSRPIGDISATINGELEVNESHSLLGLPGVALTVPAGNPFSPFANDVLLYRYLDNLLPLRRNSESVAANAAFGLNGDGLPWGSEWRWDLSAKYSRTTSETLTGTGVDPAAMQALLDSGSAGFNPFAAIPTEAIVARAADRSRSVASTGTIEAQMRGVLFKLPAGDVRASIRVSGKTSDVDSRSFRAGIARTGGSARDSGSIQGNIDLPVADRLRDVLGGIGNLGLNANAEIEQVSDFGTLLRTGYGINWSPIPELHVTATVSNAEGAPSGNQLGDPLVSTPNVRVFDFVRGETVDITTITGGNPLLSAESRRETKLGFNLRPFAGTDLNLNAEYVSSTTRNQIAGLPAVTAQLEAAFPDRFVRDPGGRLLSIDYRPVNFDRAERQQLRWGLHLSVPLPSTLVKRAEARRAERQAARERAEREGTPLPPEASARRRPGGEQGQAGGERRRRPQSIFGGGGRPRGGGGFRRGGGRGFGGPNGALAGRVMFSLTHNWTLRNQVKIADGLPILDMLDGDATGSRGGTPEHKVEGRIRVRKDGLGLNLNADWQSGTSVAAGTLGSGDRLDFGSLATVGLRLFADLGEQRSLVRKHRWMRGMRVSLGIDNLFDARQRVTDETGAVPLSYQPDLIDPQGRMIRLSIRKLLF